MVAPYLSHVTLIPDETLDRTRFPGTLPFVHDLRLEFNTPVTFFVGENGSGKSTLLEAIAVMSRLPITGGGQNEVNVSHGLDEKSLLAKVMRAGFRKRPPDGYFFRAELQAPFASLLDQRKADPEFDRDPYALYGGKSLHTMSHGEAFLSVIQNRFSDGLFLLDEPESALSPQRQLTLLAQMYDMIQDGTTQFIIATHSPILMTFPGARIISFDQGALEDITLEETTHYQITQGILNRPESYWKHLRGSTGRNETE